MSARIIPISVCLFFFILFAVPLTRGIINVGNGAGMFLSASLMLILVFWHRFQLFLGHCWEKPVGKTVISVSVIIMTASVILAAVISAFMIKAENDKPRNEDTTLVILGCQVRNGAPSLMLQGRLEAAYAYLKEHEGVKVIVSGGKGEDEIISEAQCMKEWLVGVGISPDRIYMEDRSVNTEENLRFSKEIIDKNHLPSAITIVTDGFHQLRADILAEKQGIESYNISSHTKFYLLPTYWVREWFGVIYCKIF